ncbi:MAG: RhuM family protein [Candidatus Competibacteraceae bacterium]
MNNAKQQLLIYETDSGSIEVQLAAETVWLSLQQLADLFGRDKSVISRHLKNIFQTNELKRDAVVAKNATTASDGKIYQVEYYNLDAIISIGYRVNSTQATRFRQWATSRLKDYLLQGYALNEQRLKQHQQQLEKLQKTLTLFQQTS